MRFALLHGCAGFALLGMEAVWMRKIGLAAGNTYLAAAAVTAVFFVFAAAGGLAGGALARRVRPVRLYAVAESLTGAAGVCSFMLLPAAAHLAGVPAALGAVFVALAIAAPASFCAGMAFPAAAEALVTEAGGRARDAGAVYAANALGSALGMVAGSVMLPQALGYAWTLAFMCLIHLCTGAAALLLLRRRDARDGVRPQIITSRDGGDGVRPQIFTSQRGCIRTERPTQLTIWGLTPPWGGVAYALAGMSGLAGMTLEFAALMWMRQWVHSSLYSTAAVLAAFIVNLAAGAWCATAWRRRGRPAVPLLAAAMAWTGAVAATCGVALPLLLRFTFPAMAGMAPSLAALAVAAFALVASMPAAVPAGMVFPLTWDIAAQGERHQGAVLGRLVAVNLACCALGALAAPLLLLPLLGLAGALAMAGALYAGGALVLSARTTFAHRRAAFIAAACAAAAAVALMVRQPRCTRLAAGESLVADYTGPHGVAAVVEDASPSRHIVLNQQYTLNGTSRALEPQRNESWIPLALLRSPRRVAFIGMASGISAGAALDYPIERLVAIEVAPEVIRAARAHFEEWNNGIFTDSRAEIICDDGRAVIQRAQKPFDAIICDLLLPWEDGAGALYSRDFLEIAARRITPGGLVCLWLPLYQHDDLLAGIVVRTMLDVFPYVLLVRANIDAREPYAGVIGLTAPCDMSEAVLSARLSSVKVKSRAHEPLFFRSTANFRLALLGDARANAHSFAGYPVTTDDRPAFLFHATERPAPSALLTGTNFLQWCAARSAEGSFVSCTLPAGDTAAQRAAMHAGVLYTEAGALFSRHPADSRAGMRAQIEAVRLMMRALGAAPGSEVRQEDMHY